MRLSQGENSGPSLPMLIQSTGPFAVAPRAGKGTAHSAYRDDPGPPKRRMADERQRRGQGPQKIQELAWEPMYHSPVSQYGTTTPSARRQKDPLSRCSVLLPDAGGEGPPVYGAEDARSAATCSARCKSAGWSGRSCSCRSSRYRRSPPPARCRAVPQRAQPRAAQRQAIQMIDECQALDDPAEPQAPVHAELHRPGRLQQLAAQLPQRLLRDDRPAVAEGFITGDAITAASIYLTIVAETAFTNTLFVAMPAEAAANGDYLLPTVFHQRPKRRVAAHLQRLRDPAHGAGRRGEPAAA